MRLTLIYPKWSKLMRQTEFHLPPHGPVVFAASLPDDVAVEFIDENLQSIDWEDRPDVVGISMLCLFHQLSCFFDFFQHIRVSLENIGKIKGSQQVHNPDRRNCLSVLRADRRNDHMLPPVHAIPRDPVYNFVGPEYLFEYGPGVFPVKDLSLFYSQPLLLEASDSGGETQQGMYRTRYCHEVIRPRIFGYR